MTGKNRENIKPGQKFRIVLKAPAHPRGIKVRLENGDVGLVKEILK